MPYVFSYRDSRRPDLEEFLCEVKSKRCRAVSNATGRRCSKKCAIGLPFCWIHLLQNSHLKIAPSTLQVDGESVGKGLFAAKNNRLNEEIEGEEGIVFDREDEICNYEGQRISKAILDNRYGRNTRNFVGYPPYVIQVGQTAEYEDGACLRGVGNLPNHSDNPNASLEIDDATSRIFIKAIREIRHGEEIFVDYGYNNFDLPFITYSTKQASRNSRKFRKAIEIQGRERRRERERLERSERAEERRMQRAKTVRRTSARRTTS